MHTCASTPSDPAHAPHLKKVLGTFQLWGIAVDRKSVV